MEGYGPAAAKVIDVPPNVVVYNYSTFAARDDIFIINAFIAKHDRRQILTSKVSSRAKRVNTLLLTIYALFMCVNKQQGPIFMICHYSNTRLE